MFPTRAHVEEPATALLTRQRRAFLLLALLCLVHILATWGYTGLFWEAHGRWLHEVARYAGGERPYVDFTWNGPPLSLWVLGGMARITGTSLAAISLTTSAIFVAIIMVFLLLLRRLTPDLVLAISLPAFLFAVAYAHRSGVPLPLGTAAPGVPVGFLCLLGAAAAVLTMAQRPSVWLGIGVGSLVALAMLSRPDYWLSGPYLLAAVTIVGLRRHERVAVIAAPLVAWLVVGLTGIAVPASRAGVLPVTNMIGGSLTALAQALVTPPGLERLTIDIAAAAAVSLTAVTALWLCLAISDRNAARWAGSLMCLFLTASAVHLGRSLALAKELVRAGPEPLPTLSEQSLYSALQSGRGALGSAFAFFDERLQAHLFPYVLPPILLIVLVARWRRWGDTGLRDLLGFLLGLCVIARAHRPSLGPDWNNVFIELPAHTLFFQLLCGTEKAKAARAIRAALSVLILLGIFTYVSLARGPLTLTGSYPTTATAAGTVRWPRLVTGAYRQADEAIRAVDPSGSRPLFASGLTGGWNYFLHRKNPTTETGGLAAAGREAEGTVERLRTLRPPVILIDNRYAARPVPMMGLRESLLRWEPRTEPNSYDQDLFARLREGCAPLTPDSTQAIRLFDCAQATR